MHYACKSICTSMCPQDNLQASPNDTWQHTFKHSMSHLCHANLRFKFRVAAFWWLMHITPRLPIILCVVTLESKRHLNQFESVSRPSTPLLERKCGWHLQCKTCEGRVGQHALCLDTTQKLDTKPSGACATLISIEYESAKAKCLRDKKTRKGIMIMLILMYIYRWCY